MLELPRDPFEELVDLSPRLVSSRAAVRFELLIRDSKLAKPLESEPDFEALAIATSLTRTGERRQDFFLVFLVDGPWSGTSSAEEADEDTLPVAFRFPLREPGMRLRKTMEREFWWKEQGGGKSIWMIFVGVLSLYREGM